MKTLYIDLDTTTSCTKNLAISRKEDPHWGIVDITMQTKLKKINFKIIDMNDDFVAKSFSNIACYEPFFISTWTDFLSKTEGIILDIGASTGLYSLISQAYARNRIVYAFEPYPRAYSRLILNKDINKFAKIKIIPCALADCTKIGLFMINNFEGPITTSGKISFIDNDSLQLPIKIENISNFIDIKDKIGQIKIDVEGFEIDVLQSLYPYIKQWEPVIFFECLNNNNFERLKILFSQFEYIIHGIDEKNKKLEKTTTFSGSITNFVAISNNFKW